MSGDGEVGQTVNNTTHNAKVLGLRKVNVLSQVSESRDVSVVG